MPWMTIPIAMGIAAAGSTAGTVYATRSAGKQNRRAIDAGERSDERADTREREALAEQRRALDAQLAEERRYREEQATLQREESARKERLYNEAVARDRERWQDYLKVWQPHWQMGSGVLSNLYDIAGVGGARPNPAAAAAAMSPNAPPPSSGGGMPPTGSRSPMDEYGNRGPVVLSPEGGRPPISTTMPVGRRSILPRPEMPRPQAMSLTDLMAMSDMANKFAPSAPALYQGF